MYGNAMTAVFLSFLKEISEIHSFSVIWSTHHGGKERELVTTVTLKEIFCPKIK